MTKKKVQENPNQMKSWYKILPDSFKPKYENPCFDAHKMNVPFRACVIGGSGSGKTTLVMEMIHRMKDTFGLIVLCVKNADEPLYNFLKSKLDPEDLHIYENGDVPPLDKYAKMDFQILMIFDDLVNEKDQRPMIEWYIRGRKLAKGVSMVYLSQSFYGMPKTIRIQCNYLMLKKLSSTRDLTAILKDFSLGLAKEELLTLYEYATQEKTDFLFVDIDAEPQERFRKCFLDIIPVPTY